MSPLQSPPMQRTPLSYLSWAALLLVAASAAVWLKHEEIVVRLLSEGLIDEQATRTLPETLRYGALAAAIVGLVAAWQFALRGGQIVYGWTPVQRLAAPVLQPLGALLVSLRGLVWAVLLTTRNAIVAPPRLAWRLVSTAFARLRWATHAVASGLQRGAAAILQRVWLDISAIARPIGAAARYMGQVVLLPPYAVWLVLAAVAHQLERGVSTVSRWLNALLGAAWHRVTSVAGTLCSAVVASARTVSLALASIAHALWRAFRLPPHAVWLVLDAAAHRIERTVAAVSRRLQALLNTLWRQVTIVGNSLRLGVATIVHAADVALLALQRAFTSALRDLAAAFVALLGLVIVLPLVAVSRVLATVARQFGRAVGTVSRRLQAMFDALWRRGIIALGHLRIGVATMLRPLWLAASGIVHLAGAALCALRLAVTSALHDLAAGFVILLALFFFLPLFAVSLTLAAVAHLFGRAADTVSRWLQALLDALWRRGIIALDYLRIGVATMFRPLWLAASGIVHLAGAALCALRLAVTSALHDLAAGFVILLALFFFLPLFAVSLALAAVAPFIRAGCGHGLSMAAGAARRPLARGHHRPRLPPHRRRGHVPLSLARCFHHRSHCRCRAAGTPARSHQHSPPPRRELRGAAQARVDPAAPRWVGHRRDRPVAALARRLNAGPDSGLRGTSGTNRRFAATRPRLAGPADGRTHPPLVAERGRNSRLASVGRMPLDREVRGPNRVYRGAHGLGLRASGHQCRSRAERGVNHVRGFDSRANALAHRNVLGAGHRGLLPLRTAPPGAAGAHGRRHALGHRPPHPRWTRAGDGRPIQRAGPPHAGWHTHRGPGPQCPLTASGRVSNRPHSQSRSRQQRIRLARLRTPHDCDPSSAHWLVNVNYELERELVDLAAARSIVRPVIGIVTYEEMARCLGWPEKELGFADILELRDDPQGWAKYDCAKAEWGQRPLVAYTDPATSSTGRSLLLALYAIAAGKLPEELTEADVTDPDVVGYVENFASLVDHYLIGTTVLNTKIHQGPGYGHFFIMPEDNLIHLYEGTERVFINGKKVTAPLIDRRMVTIYPKEGAMPRSNCACIVQSSWVTEEQAEAAAQWTDYLLEDDQQRSFMAAGFRPGTDISLADPSSKITSEFGLDPTKPSAVLNPALTAPAVAAAIDASWVDVKRPGIVTFVVDTSGSMMGNKHEQAQAGLIAALDAMAKNNQVGFIAFDDRIHSRVPVGPLALSRFLIADAVRNLRAGGETALYDAIKTAIEMTDAADGDPDAIRAIVVLTDGRANRGETRLSDLVEMMSSHEAVVPELTGMQGETTVRDARGNRVTKESVIGTGLALSTRYPIQVFFIGIGDDADLDIGRILAQATSAEFQGVTEQDLANVLEEFSGYF